MPQLKYLLPEDDTDWASSPSPEPEHEPLPRPASLAPRNNTTEYNVPVDEPTSVPSLEIPESAPSPELSTHAEQVLPNPSHETRRSPSFRSEHSPSKRRKLQVVDLQEEYSLDTMTINTNAYSASPASSSNILHSFMVKAPKVAKDEWSDDSSDEVEQTKQEGTGLYHKSAQVRSGELPSHNHTREQGPGNEASHEKIDEGSKERIPRHRRAPAIIRASTNGLTETTGTAKPRKKNTPHFARWRFPKIAREDLKCYVFLAACIKHNKLPFRPDWYAVGHELGLAHNSVGRKLSQLRKRLAEHGPTLGSPEVMQVYEAHDPFAYDEPDEDESF